MSKGYHEASLNDVLTHFRGDRDNGEGEFVATGFDQIDDLTMGRSLHIHSVPASCERQVRLKQHDDM